MPKRKCRQCKEYTENYTKTLQGVFCSYQHAIDFVNGKKERDRLKAMDKKLAKKKAARKKKSALQMKKDNPRSSYWKKKADLAWGAVIHQSKACLVNHECSGNLEAHHLISRAQVSTRHAVENGVLLCSKHHKFSSDLSAHKAPLAFAEFLQNLYPEKWEWASENKNKIGKPDYKAAYERLAQLVLDI